MNKEIVFIYKMYLHFILQHTTRFASKNVPILYLFSYSIFYCTNYLNILTLSHLLSNIIKPNILQNSIQICNAAISWIPSLLLHLTQLICYPISGRLVWLVWKKTYADLSPDFHIFFYTPEISPTFKYSILQPNVLWFRNENFITCVVVLLYDWSVIFYMI